MCADAFVFDPRANPAMFRARERSLVEALLRTPPDHSAYRDRAETLEAPTQPVRIEHPRRTG